MPPSAPRSHPAIDAVRASVGSVGCAVHAKAKTALEVAEEIARAASARLPKDTGDLVPAIREVLDEHGGRRFNVIIDALDEAASPEQARAIIDQVALPLAETCSDAGAQVVVGTRRRDDGGNLLDRFGGALEGIDLDDPRYFAEEDLAAYALACLQLAGDERPGNPYLDDTLAGPVAGRIAAMAGRNFLIAGLIARSRGLHDEEAADPGQLGFSATVDSALASLPRAPQPVEGVPADRALTALAFAEAPGCPPGCGSWRSRPSTGHGQRRGADPVRPVVGGQLPGRNGQRGRRRSSRCARRGVPAVPPGTQRRDAAGRSEVMPRADDERALTLAFTGMAGEQVGGRP